MGTQVEVLVSLDRFLGIRSGSKVRLMIKL